MDDTEINKTNRPKKKKFQNDDVSKKFFFSYFWLGYAPCYVHFCVRYNHELEHI